MTICVTGLRQRAQKLPWIAQGGICGGQGLDVLQQRLAVLTECRFTQRQMRIVIEGRIPASGPVDIHVAVAVDGDPDIGCRAIQPSCIRQGDMVSRINDDIRHFHLQHIGGHRQSQRWEQHIIIAVDEGKTPTGTIDIGHGLCIGESTGRLAQRLQWGVEILALPDRVLFAAGQARRARANHLQGALLIGRQWRQFTRLGDDCLSEKHVPRRFDRLPKELIMV